MKTKRKDMRTRNMAAEDVLRIYSDELADLTPAQQQHPIRQSGKYKAEVELMHTLMADLEVLAEDTDIVPASIRSQVVVVKKQPRWSIAAMVACVALTLLALLGPLSKKDIELPASQRYVTRIGEFKTVVLPDGSVIDMNTNSEMLVDISGTLRHVELRRGEAYFDVFRDDSSPFTVDVGDRQVTVLGTEFNIRRGDRSLKVAVTEGLVAFHKTSDKELGEMSEVQLRVHEMRNLSGADAIALRAGQVAEFDVGIARLMVSNIPDMSSAHSWRTGILKFKSVPLYKVLEELNRYSGRPISLKADRLRNYPVYAAIDVRELGRALRLLDKMLPVHVKQESDRILIVEQESVP